ncbi:MAG: hypothetical protein ACYTGC_19205 [Planctomycetota bacterium]
MTSLRLPSFLATTALVCGLACSAGDRQVEDPLGSGGPGDPGAGPQDPDGEDPGDGGDDPGDDGGDGGTPLLDVGDDGGDGGGGGDEVEDCKAVDLLFVIDSSGSMADEQAHLIASFEGFIEGIQSKLTDQTYHVGVMATDAYAGNAAECQQLGALVTATAGTDSSESVCDFPDGQRYVTEQDDLAGLFSCAAQLGTVGSGDEQPMGAIVQAMSGVHDGPGGCNEGFLRDDALLVIVIITDEEDDHEGVVCPDDIFPSGGGSEGEPAAWYDAVVAAKDGRPNAVVSLSLVGPPGPDPAMCPALDKCADAIMGAEPAHRITDFTESFDYGFVGRVCDDSYHEFFNAAIDNIVEACDNFPPEG